MNGRRLTYRDSGWRPLIEEFREANLLPEDYGVRVRHRCYSGATGSPWEYSVHVTLWRIDDFYVFVDEPVGGQDVFESRAEAMAAYQAVADELDGGP